MIITVYWVAAVSWGRSLGCYINYLIPSLYGLMHHYDHSIMAKLEVWKRENEPLVCLTIDPRHVTSYGIVWKFWNSLSPFTILPSKSLSLSLSLPLSLSFSLSLSLSRNILRHRCLNQLLCPWLSPPFEQKWYRDYFWGQLILTYSKSSL
jgi:hypothetical protein